MAEEKEKLTNGVKLVGEALTPGISLLMDGKLGSGAAHVLVGFVARWALGPIGYIATAANSYSKSVNDKYLWEYVGDALKKKEAEVPAKPEASPA
jgi:hypothetical protein